MTEPHAPSIPLRTGSPDSLADAPDSDGYTSASDWTAPTRDTDHEAIDEQAPRRRPALRALREIARMAFCSAICLAVGALIFVLFFGMTLEQHDNQIPERAGLVLALDLGLGALTNAASGPLRRTGLWNLVLVLPSAISGSSVPAAAVGLYRVGTRRDWRTDACGVVLCTSAALVYGFVYHWADPSEPPTPWVDLAAGAIVATVSLLIGRVRGTRMALIESLRRQTVSVQRERAAIERSHEALAREHRALVAQAKAEQRSSIARDMHDSLSHHLSLIALHAGALGYREDMSPSRMRETSALIRDAARSANAELRNVLSALREDAAPLPTAADLVAQVAESRAEGHDISLTWEDVTPADLDAASSTLAVAVVRIFREVQTNARKHAPGQPLDLRVARRTSAAGADELTLAACNPINSPAHRPEEEALGTGMGLTGLRERVHLLGGTCTIGPRSCAPDEQSAAAAEAQIFTVDVHLPWPSNGGNPR